MAKNWHDLFSFCSQYEYLICYGASDHGHVVKHFLENHNIKVDAFMVTDDVSQSTVRDGIPLYSVTEIKSLPANCGILLSLYERHHASVMQRIRAARPDISVYVIGDDNLVIMHNELNEETCRIILSAPITADENARIDYEQRFHAFQAKYERIEIRLFDVRAIGGYVYWTYYSYCRKQDASKNFYLYYPFGFENHPESRLKGANGYLLEQLKGDGLEVLSQKNVNFWRYVSQEHEEYFSIQNEQYELADWSSKLKTVYKDVPLNEKYAELDVDADTRNMIAKLGIREPFVCISNRDHVFLQTQRGDKLKPMTRDIYRNSDIETQRGAVDYLASQNIQAVRMGALVEKEFHHVNVIDYASRYRSEKLDAALVDRCKFFVGDVSGILAFPILLAKPMVLLNSPQLTVRYDGILLFDPERDIALLKKLWDKRKQRFLTVREMLDYEINICNTEKGIQGALFGEYLRREIVPVNNTSEEIHDAVEEMNQRLDGTVKYDSLDIELQSRYREIVDSFPPGENIKFRWRLGTAFLRQNQWLLQ